MASSSSSIEIHAKEFSKKRSRDQSDSVASSEKRRRIHREKQRQFSEILTQLKQSHKKTKEEREGLFTELKTVMQEGDIDLTFTIKPSGWNILHLIVFFNRIDVLISVQQSLLPELEEQYRKMLLAKTKTTGATPISMLKPSHKVVHREEISALLNETSLPLLKNKQLEIILKILVSSEIAQRGTLYEQLQQLVKQNVDLTITEETKGFTALHYAVEDYDIDLVRDILQHSSLKQCEILLSTRTKDGLTPISMAKENNFEQIFSLLVKKKNLIQIFVGLNLLGKAKDKQALYEKIKQFIKTGGDPTSQDDRGRNFLHYAACFKDIDLVRLVKQHSTPQQYQILLHTQSKKSNATPYKALELQKKGSVSSELRELLNPEAAQNIPPSSQQAGGAFTFFNPTFLGDETAPVPTPVRSSLSPTKK